MKARSRGFTSGVVNVVLALLLVALGVLLVVSVIKGVKRGPMMTIDDAQATVQAALEDYKTQQAGLPTPTAQVVEVIKTVEVLVTPTAVPVTWSPVVVSKYFDPISSNGSLWELPFGTHFAVSTANGRYEAVPSTVTGRKENDWCGSTQYDCPPHLFLVRVEVPDEYVDCVHAMMDISYRFLIDNGTCGNVDIPVRITLRLNTITQSSDELLKDYLSAAGGMVAIDPKAVSELGAFVALSDDFGTAHSSLIYKGQTINFGYSCWDCLPHTTGPNRDYIFLNDKELTFEGTSTAPLGNSMYPGVVLPILRPADMKGDFQVEVLAKAGKPVVFWLGRYITFPLSLTATPTPTATP